MKIHHLPFFNNHCYLILRRHKGWCSNCKALRSEKVDFISPLSAHISAEDPQWCRGIGQFYKNFRLRLFLYSSELVSTSLILDMGRYFLFYFALISLLCLGTEIFNISSDESKIIQWSPTDFSVDFSNPNKVLVVPENFQISNKNGSFKEGSLNYLTTEPHRIPQESTGDLFNRVSESPEGLSLYCVEKAFYDCMEFLARYPDFNARIEKVYVLFPDKISKYLMFAEQRESLVLRGSTGQSLLRKSAQWIYDLFFEVENSYERFTAFSKRNYLAQNKARFKGVAGKVEILQVSPKGPF